MYIGLLKTPQTTVCAENNVDVNSSTLFSGGIFKRFLESEKREEFFPCPEQIINTKYL